MTLPSPTAPHTSLGSDSEESKGSKELNSADVNYHGKELTDVEMSEMNEATENLLDGVKPVSGSSIEKPQLEQYDELPVDNDSEESEPTLGKGIHQIKEKPLNDTMLQKYVTRGSHESRQARRTLIENLCKREALLQRLFTLKKDERKMRIGILTKEEEEINQELHPHLLSQYKTIEENCQRKIFEAKKWCDMKIELAKKMCSYDLSHISRELAQEEATIRNRFAQVVHDKLAKINDPTTSRVKRRGTRYAAKKRSQRNQLTVTASAIDIAEDIAAIAQLKTTQPQQSDDKVYSRYQELHYNGVIFRPNSLVYLQASSERVKCFITSINSVVVYFRDYDSPFDTRRVFTSQLKSGSFSLEAFRDETQ